MANVGYLRTAALVYVLASSVLGQTVRKKEIQVTAVSGESWLRHLHRSFNETSMGKTGHLGPPESALVSEGSRLPSVASLGRSERTVTLYGSDLYRLNCQGCHGELGLGAPPEINSVINPVRASSASAVAERMKQVGMAMSRAEIDKLAKQSRDALLERLHHGGQDMPAFPHLSEAEIASLMAYLKQLANVPGAEPIEVRTTSLRVGEHIVKSTCHICHDADGPDPTPQQILDGQIPPLSTLSSRVSGAQFVRKVTRGAPVAMGTLRLVCRGRMPLFYYLSEEEAADVYLYLTLVRPAASLPIDQTIAASQSGESPRDADPPPAVSNEPHGARVEPASVQRQSEGEDAQSVALLAVVGVLVSLLLAGGVALTLRECMRLSTERDSRNAAAVRGLPGESGDADAREAGDRLIA
jgi:mono/diheme cytochrome c family protein